MAANKPASPMSQPHFFVGVYGPEIGKWVRQSKDNEMIVRSVFEGGISGLLRLYVDVVNYKLTIDRLRKLNRLIPMSSARP